MHTKNLKRICGLVPQIGWKIFAFIFYRLVHNGGPPAAGWGFTCCIFSSGCHFLDLLPACFRIPPQSRLTACYALGGDSTRNLFCKLVLQMGLRVDDQIYFSL
jgi:hypothetical protein